MLDENKFMQYGFPRARTDILGITIHETDKNDVSASGLEQWLNEENKTSAGCYHYICDDEQVVQIMPNDWGVYHTGKALDWGNQYTISVALCSTLSDEKYSVILNRAVDLINALKNEYGISDEMIFFHNSFNEKVYCPRRLLDEYKSVKRFVMEEL